jgi:alcohol dehydrogenase class IV
LGKQKGERVMDDLLNLRKFVAPEIIFGTGARKLVGKHALQYKASKVFIVTDGGVIEAGWLKDVEESLSNVGISSYVYKNVSPNPRISEVMQGAEEYRNEGCDVIVAVGGGSPMDCAKAIGVVSAEKLNILEFCGIDKIQKAIPPLMFVPTTGGSSADVSQFCILSDRENLSKIAIVSKALVPDISLIDPETLSTMDPFLAACTGMDVLVHAIEAFVSFGSGPLTDSFALDAIELIKINLPDLVHHNNNVERRKKVMLASLKAGLAFSNASMGAVHAMSHSLGGLLDLPHGECNAMVLEHVINFNFQYAPEKYEAITKALGIDTRGLSQKSIKSKLVETIIAFKTELGLHNSIGQRGVSFSDIPRLSIGALKDVCMLTNPRKANTKDLEVIFKEAF